ncbi:hypothetical protein AiwAL_09995 [Acidiphilium sp. AL]|nr:hypothetical protein [Acidiphilium sp. AL]MCU4160438.1 hypothetical protein [Acidiphilium sp. AL]
MPGHETLVLRDAVLVPEPFAVIDRDGITRAGTTPSKPAEPADTVLLSNAVAPMAAGASVPLGRFLGNSLSIASMQRAMFGEIGFAGPPLTPPQADALAAMGLLGAYTPLSEPVRVEKLLLTLQKGQGFSRMIRPAIETLRFAAEPYEVNPRIAILEPVTRTRFTRGNQFGFQAWLRAQSFAFLDPDAMRLGNTQLGLFDLISVLAAARLVVIDDPAQAPLLGFCDPGTIVIQLGIDGWPDGAIATCARLFSLEWRLVLAFAPHYPVRGPLPLGERKMLRTEIDIAALGAALASVEGDVLPMKA